MVKIGDRIKIRREQLNISQLDLAESIGTSQKQISRYERGENMPTSDVVVAIAKALDVSADWLLGLTEITKPIYQGDDLGLDEIELIQLYRSKAPDKQTQLIEIAKVV